MENRFKDILKQLREELGMSQAKLAEAVGLSHGLISLYENGLREPGMTNIIMLARFFKVTTDFLLGEEE